MDDGCTTRAIDRRSWTPWAGILVLALETGALASPPVSEDVPLPGGIAALARALDIDAPDPARCLAEIARLAYGDAERSRQGSPYRRLLAHFAVAGSPTGADGERKPELIPVPLTASIWSGAVFRRPVTSQTLVAAILSDPNAALLAYGLSALEDETLQFLADHPALLAALYERHAAAFASFAAHLRVRKGRVVPPGGDPAVPLWEAALDARVADPAAFVAALYARADGRIAYLYDVIGHLDAARAAFALGLWLPDSAMRVERFRALLRIASSAVSEWKASKVAFSRPAFDLVTLFTRVQVERSGAPRFPASQRLWRAALGRGEDQADSPHDRLIDAAWLAEALLQGHGQMRRQRLDQFAFGHRAFTSAPDAAPADLIAVIGSFPRVPALMLTLERLGLRDPGIYAALARHAQRLTPLDAPRGQRALAQFQGAVALVARLTRVRSIDHAAAARLLDALARVAVDAQRGYMGGMASWLDHHVRPAISRGPSATLDDALVQALAGPSNPATATPLMWEGQTYLFDLHASEAARLRRFRDDRSVPSLETAIQIHRAATTVDAGPGGAGVSGGTLAVLRATLSKLPTSGSTVPLGIEPVARAVAATRTWLDAADALTADALLSLSYAIEWRDGQRRAGFDRELPRRHDFGLTSRSSDAHARGAWAVPRLVFRPGEPWHAEGALLGLDVALAPLALREIDQAPRLRAPRLLSTHRDAFVAGLGLLDVFALRDADGNAMAEAIARGQRRVEALVSTSRDFTTVIDEIRMDGWRARALRWSLVHAPDRVPALFSMTELLHLGGGGQLDVHPWGMSALPALGCLCTHVPPPGLHTAFVGRDHVGLLPLVVPDLHLRVAVAIHELRLPVALARNALEAALAEFLIDVSPAYPDDWLAYVRRARAVSGERVADYLAAVTAAAAPDSTHPSARRLP